MKVSIVGPVASGKTTIAYQLSVEKNVKMTGIDELVWIRQKSKPDIRRSHQQRIENIDIATAESQWIIEGAQVRLILESDLIEKSDYVFILKPNRMVVYYRILKRFLSQTIGLDKRNIYKPKFSELKNYYRWANKFYDNEFEMLYKMIPRSKTTILTGRNAQKNMVLIREIINK